MTAPNGPEAEEFVDRVDEVSRLIAGLSAGTISADYIDSKYNSKYLQQDARLEPSKAAAPAPTAEETAAAAKAVEKEEARRATLIEKAAQLKKNYERKLKARARFEEYSNTQRTSGQDTTNSGTDYTRWDMWCPEDEEDELINSITPNSSAFKAMEKDIDERHNR